MRDEAEKRIGHMYPKAKLQDGSEATVVAWIWARTITCPNPACGISMPLVRSWWLSKRKGKEAYIIPHVSDERIEFSVGHGLKAGPTKAEDGTVTRTGAICVACETAVPLAYVRAEGKSKRMSAQLMAVAAEGSRRRIYLPPTPEHEQAAMMAVPKDAPDTEIPYNPRYLTTPNYGMNHHIDLFTSRQLTALITFSDLVKEAREKVIEDAISGGSVEGCRTEYDYDMATAYAGAVATYLGLGVGRFSDISNSLCRWENTKTQVRNLFTRQAISMMWDFAEAPPFGSAAGGFLVSIGNLARALERTPATNRGIVDQSSATNRSYANALVSTDPPYYDNVGYADLSDFFYVWLRRSLRDVYPALLGTMLTPKDDELVADPFRRGGKGAAEKYFEAGFVHVFGRIRKSSPGDLPITVFYAFKQAEADVEGTASTGWEVLLQGMIGSGWEITATWPIRTELGNRMRSLDSNALASSVVLSCRPRADDAVTTTRRAFMAELKRKLPTALGELQQGSIAPVDLAQAAIGPGMAVFSRYVKVVEPDGSTMTVRSALTEINRALDEVLSEQEGDFDGDTRFCLKWFSQFGWDEADSGTADTLRAVNTSVGGLVQGDIFWQRAGRARLFEAHELVGVWDPATDDRISVWEVVLRLAKALSEEGVDEAARLMALASQRVDLDASKELAYLLFSICEKRKWTRTALLFNGLGTSWSDLSAVAQTGGALTPAPLQGEINFNLGGE